MSSRGGQDHAGLAETNSSIDWLKYSNGMSLKCLRAMGYQAGKGLGATLQGRPMPINHESMGLNIQIDKGGAIIGGASNKYAGLGYNTRFRKEGPHSVRSQEATQTSSEKVQTKHELDSKPQRKQQYVRTFSNRMSGDEGEEDIIDSENSHQVIEGNHQQVVQIEDVGSDEDCLADRVEEEAVTPEVGVMVAAAHRGMSIDNNEQQNKMIPVFNTSSGERCVGVSSQYDRPQRENVMDVLQMLNLGGQECLTFYDSGATCNVILGELAERLNLAPVAGVKKVMRGLGNKVVWSPYGTYEFKLGPTRESKSDVHLYVQGMPEITGSINEVDLSEVKQEVMQDEVIARRLSQEVLPSKVGGGPVSLLIGVNQINIMPVLRFSLPCGLGVFESQVADVNGSFWCFGGPHHSITRANKMTQGLKYDQSINLLREVAGAYMRSPYILLVRVLCSILFVGYAAAELSSKPLLQDDLLQDRLSINVYI